MKRCAERSHSQETASVLSKEPSERSSLPRYPSTTPRRRPPGKPRSSACSRLRRLSGQLRSKSFGRYCKAAYKRKAKSRHMLDLSRTRDLRRLRLSQTAKPVRGLDLDGPRGNI